MAAGRIQSFRDLIAWQKAIALCKLVYAVSAGFPKDDRFGLTSQIRRAAVSIPTNIAAGYGRRQTNDYILEAAAASDGRLVPFCCVQPRAGHEARCEMQRCAGGGARGGGRGRRSPRRPGRRGGPRPQRGGRRVLHECGRGR